MTEVWLTGPIDGVQPIWMPAAHALTQARRDISHLLDDLSLDEIWSTVGTSASIGFHALHLAGATDRLMTYARGEELSATQLADARAEKTLEGLAREEIIARVHHAIDTAIGQIRVTPPETITDARSVGRQKLPATVLGLIFHTAEHATRHAGQIATLRKVLGK
jgi:uncharacterized damage-inducible protein DinB